ncbi:hypothetical protein [Aphanothece sacrum]|uniref:Type I restriction enzyme R protein N-terminal domain-containing protein n=1 Tax=Aphanothece sacrum FPU1 TaxID=1920663 RepID=A0A401IEZ1_APHSA|nr:hypothetical protein [Aphanothece sacrum]GBF79835.1 hypothetical protein AsFPU1_1235 [Aphanothece sacrum FPU1]GBF84847.1 hypothetical protein AsFPU3_1902 [Aphanothece sacrum FPU3]
MAFSNFKNIADVQQKYQIKYQEDNFILAEEISPPEVFLQDFNFYKENIDIFTSEASRSEIIISPLLREIYKQHYQKYSFWIQKSINYDHILSGTPDYILSKKSVLGKTVLENPIVIIVEAKKNDFEQGWGQCLAELVASQKLNKDPKKPVYGIVTDGNLWQFGKLLENTFTQDRENFTIDKLPRLYGSLAYLFQLVESDNES